ncbi:MAG: polyphosphate kinase 1 [Candidatus Eutrophobiaceae bacterium]
MNQALPKELSAIKRIKDAKNPTIPLELSWLSFNERVLQEAEDMRNPIMERFRFLGIFSSNQDEFFKVRVANIQRSIDDAPNPEAKKTYARLLREVQKIVVRLGDRFELAYQNLLKELAKQNIHFLLEDQLDKKQSVWLLKHFREKILRHIVPILLTQSINLRTRLQHDTTYLVVELAHRGDKQYAIVDVPVLGQCFVKLPESGKRKACCYMVLDEVIRHCMGEIFENFFNYESLRVWSMKFSRDASFTLTDDPYRSFYEKVGYGIRQREGAEAVRLGYERGMPNSLLNLLRTKLGMDEFDSLSAGGRYRNFSDFISFPNPGRKSLEYRPMPALLHKRFLAARSAFAAIDEGDIMLYHPYHRFSHFTEFVRQASMDPNVGCIYINVYRVAHKSRVIESLIDAAANGKRVVLNIELRARFDEESNLELAKLLDKSGIQVMFGIPSLKVHSKICLVERRVQDSMRRYACVSSGNFNEETAKLYCDLSLFTSDQELCSEFVKVFELIEKTYLQYDFRYLLVSPLNVRGRLNALIDREIENCRQGIASGITLKVNNISDERIIAKLYEASQAGVKIMLIVRSVCTLVPGISGMSENIRVISLVGRFLEHARILWFHDAGQHDLYITSCDLMTRNLDERIELGCPVRDENARNMLIEIINAQLKDNCKARVIDIEQGNGYAETGRKRLYDSQMKIYALLSKWEG